MKWYQMASERKKDDVVSNESEMKVKGHKSKLKKVFYPQQYNFLGQFWLNCIFMIQLSYIVMILHKWFWVWLCAPFIWPCATSKQKKLLNY